MGKQRLFATMPKFIGNYIKNNEKASHFNNFIHIYFPSKNEKS